MRDSADNRLKARRGEDITHAKLRENDVRRIRECHALRSATVKEMATTYGVHFRTIEKVVYYESWVHVL